MNVFHHEKDNSKKPVYDKFGALDIMTTFFFKRFSFLISKNNIRQRKLTHQKWTNLAQFCFNSYIKARVETLFMYLGNLYSNKGGVII